MQQQINLYSYLPRPVKSLLTVHAMFYIYVIFVGLLFFITLHGEWYKHTQHRNLAMLTLQLADAQQTLDATHARFPSINLQDIGLNVHTLQQALDEKAKVYMLLSHKIKFSTYMLGLANASVSGAWITEFTFFSDEHGITLKGVALQPSNIENFLAQLKAQGVFENMMFELQDLNEATAKDAANSILNFYITTRTIEAT